jgi:rhamnulokinase
MGAAIREWCRAHGEPVPQSEGELIRCALESLAFKYRVVLEWLEELTGARIHEVHIVGGGSQNEALNQLTADACGRPVIAGPVEATVLGNVLVQARVAGQLGTLSEVRSVVRASSDLNTFEPRDTAAWNDAYPRFVKLLAASTGTAAI